MQFYFKTIDKSRIPSLTYDLDIDYGWVLVVFHLHCHVILARVAAFCFTDEDDAVTVCVTDADMRGIYGLPLLQPVHFRPGFALDTTQSSVSSIVSAELKGTSWVTEQRGCFTINGTTRLTASPTLRVYVCFKWRGMRILGGSAKEIEQKLCDKGVIFGPVPYR